MFIRFVRSNKVDGLMAREGFFCAAYELRDRQNLDPHTAKQLEVLLSWFRQHLKIPKKFSRSRSKGSKRRLTKGLSWFKPSARNVLAKSHELVVLLEAQGYPIETIHSDRIGYVVYEDDHQVVAEPFADTRI